MSIPVIPPMAPRVRAVLYGIWAWLSIIVPTIAVGLAVFTPTPPLAIVAALVVLQYLGSALGFTARANVNE